MIILLLVFPIVIDEIELTFTSTLFKKTCKSFFILYLMDYMIDTSFFTYLSFLYSPNLLTCSVFMLNGYKIIFFPPTLFDMTREVNLF